MNDPNSIGQILWSADPMTQRAIRMVLGFALITVVTIFIPLLIRQIRLFLLTRKLRSLTGYSADPIESDDAKGALKNANSRSSNTAVEVDREELRNLFLDSPAKDAYIEFERRWTTSQLVEDIERAPIRMLDILEERPLLPFGPRRSLLPALPGLFLGLGAFAALIGLIPSLGGAATDAITGDGRATWVAAQLGLALRATAWGFLCAIAATLTGRFIEGGFDARSASLDRILERVFGSVSPGELAEITRQTQQRSLDTLGGELTRFANELNERLDRGLQRIEQSTARSANLVSQEQRGALHTIVQELSLSVRQGVEHHLGELRGALQRSVEHQTSVTSGLAETFERMVENSHTQERVARTLAESATAVDEAARAMRDSTTGMQPVFESLSTTSRGLSDTADRISDTQKVVARTAEGVRSSLEHAASGVDAQRQFLELSLGEIRRALVGLGDGLGDGLERSLRSVDDVLNSTVGQLRATLSESNETIERLAVPIRAAEGSTRETHVALDRVRSEVEALGQWMSLAIKPLRSGLTDVETRAEEIVRSMNEFTSGTRQMDKSMDALREEIHEESRRLQGAGNELGRRLKLTSDAVGLLENTTSDAARRKRTDGTPATPRERNWSHTPSDREDQKGAPSYNQHRSSKTDTNETRTDQIGSASIAGASLTDGNKVERTAVDSTRDAKVASKKTSQHQAKADSDDADSKDRRSDADDSNDGRTRTDSHAEAGDPESSESAGRELTQSGYRVGAPRAQGPDPYARLESETDTPSNVRHFPTRDRELGDELKLSGLLGPSKADGGDEDDTESSDSKSESNKKNASHRNRSAQSSDDRE